MTLGLTIGTAAFGADGVGPGVQPANSMQGRVHKTSLNQRLTLTSEQVAAAENLPASAPLNNPLWKSAYALDVELVSTDFDGNILDDATVPLVEREWAFIDRWVVEQSSKQSRVNGSVLHSLITEPDPSLMVLALDLQPMATLISVNQSDIGHVVIVTRRHATPRLDCGAST